MTSKLNLSLAALVAASMAGPAFAATGGDAGQGTTISPTSPTMSVPSTPSHDGNHQLGYLKSAEVPGGPRDQSGTARAGDGSETTNPSNNPNCGGAC